MRPGLVGGYVRLVAVPLLIVAVASAIAAPSQKDPAALDRLWSGGDAESRERLAEQIATRLEFEPALALAQRGPSRRPDADTGRILRANRIDGVDHPYLVLVPETYDPQRRYPVRFYLHGGVARADIPPNGGWWRQPDRMATDDAIAVFPASWSDSRWWQRSQLRSLRAILDALKVEWNVDENRVSMFGVSDGGTGAWYYAFLDATPWASFVPLIGHPAVLANPRVGGDVQLHVANLTNRDFLAINGEVDRLYPARSVQPYVEFFRSVGVGVDFVVKAGADHTVRWWPDEAERIEEFLAAHPRDPLPDQLTWETADSEGSGRHHWLVIEELGAATDDAEMPPIEREVEVGGRRQFLGFPTARPSGRVVISTDDNRIDVRTRGVRRFRLLLSPEQFDLTRPVQVTVNGAVRFDGSVVASADVLLKWLARDLDRTMLFAAELPIELPTN